MQSWACWPFSSVLWYLGLFLGCWDQVYLEPLSRTRIVNIVVYLHILSHREVFRSYSMCGDVTLYVTNAVFWNTSRTSCLRQLDRWLLQVDGVYSKIIMEVWYSKHIHQ